jgi:cytochrome c oxidase cbb3-type subunit IV
MTIDDLRITVTVISFLCFIGLLVWAWSARNRAPFHEASHLPFAHDGHGGEESTPIRSDPA